MKSIKIATFLIAASFSMVGVVSAEVMTIELKKGRSELVDVLELNGDKIKVKWLKDGRVLSFPLSRLSDDSQKEVLKKIKKSTSSYPPVEAEVSVGKRRKSGSSSYMTSMTITSKVTVTNEDRNVTCPPCKCNIIFVGQSQRNTSKYVVLSNQAFTIEPTNRGALFESEPFVTTYDSDNRGVGNSGGYKYVGYLVVVADKKKHVLFSKTIYPALKKAIAKDSQLVAGMTKYETGTYMNKSMIKPKVEKFGTTRF